MGDHHTNPDLQKNKERNENCDIISEKHKRADIENKIETLQSLETKDTKTSKDEPSSDKVAQSIDDTVFTEYSSKKEKQSNEALKNVKNSDLPSEDPVTSSNISDECVSTAIGTKASEEENMNYDTSLRISKTNVTEDDKKLINGKSSNLFGEDVKKVKLSIDINQPADNIFMKNKPKSKAVTNSSFLTNVIKKEDIAENIEVDKSLLGTLLFESKSLFYKFTNKKWEKIGTGHIYIYKTQELRLIFVRDGLMTVSFDFYKIFDIKPSVKDKGVLFKIPTGELVLLMFEKEDEKTKFFELIK